MDDMMILVVYSPGTGPCFVFLGHKFGTPVCIEGSRRGNTRPS